MVEKMEMNVDRLILVMTIKNIFRYILLKLNYFSYFETKGSLSTSVFMFSIISQILKRNFYVL